MDLPHELRECTKCHSVKHISQFRKNPNRGKDGLSSWCKTCLREKDKRRNGSEGYREMNKARCTTLVYQKKHRDYVARVKQERYTQKILFQMICSAAAIMYYLSKPTEPKPRPRPRPRPVNKVCKRCGEEKPINDFLLQKAIYCSSCREQNKKDREVIKWHRRRLRKNGSTIFTSDWRLVVKHYSPDGKCLCCGKKAKLTLDHVVPLFLGGVHDISNVQPLCVSCNSKKGGKNSMDFRPDRGAYARSLLVFSPPSPTAFIAQIGHGSQRAHAKKEQN